MKKILVLTPKSGVPTKTLDEKLNKISNYKAGLLYKFETIPYKNFHKALEKILPVNSCFIVLGELTEYGKELEAENKTGLRRKKTGKPTIQDCDGVEIVLDLDDHIIPKFDPLNPVPSLTTWMRKRKIDCDFTWQITSSQKLNTEEARVRIFFECTKPASLLHRKAWSQSEKIQADGSVYSSNQPIYTAPPIIISSVDKNKIIIKDPIPKRFGFVEGKIRTFDLPSVSKDHLERAKSSGFTSASGEQYDFTSSSLPPEVLSGKVYRRYFMAMAFSLANKNLSREDIFILIKTKSLQVKSREFHADNTYDYIDQALEKIAIEKEDRELASADDLIEEDSDENSQEKIALPEFPTGILETWPEPWPMLWETFKTAPRELEEPLLIPTVLALNAFFLRANYVTEYRRRPNMFFLNLTPSTGNKDVNSKNVIRDIDREFHERGAKTSLFSGILNTESSITADTSFIQSFDDKDELFWINTEATRIFQQLKGSANNSSVAALSDKLIEVVDGHEITGKTKSGSKVKTIKSPNCQVLFYAQPETIEQYIDENMVDSGLFGRALLTILPDLKMEDSYSMFHAKKSHKIKMSNEFYEFYTSQKFNMSSMSVSQTVLKPNKKSLELMDDWARETIFPYMKEDAAMQKVLSRIGNSTEQLYTIVLGICQLYDASIGADVRTEINVAPLLPLAEYWTETKIYAIQNYINTSLDPLHDHVLEVLRSMLKGKPEMSRSNDRKILKDKNVIPASQLLNKIKQNKRLSRLLDSSADKKNVVTRVNSILDLSVRNGTIVRINSGEKFPRVCYGIPKGY